MRRHDSVNSCDYLSCILPIFLLFTFEPFAALLEDVRGSLPITLRSGVPTECNWCNLAYRTWRSNVWLFAKGLGGLAFAIFSTITLAGLIEDIDYMWKVSLTLAVVIAIGALVSAVFACLDARDTVEEHQLGPSTGFRTIHGRPRELPGTSRDVCLSSPSSPYHPV